MAEKDFEKAPDNEFDGVELNTDENISGTSHLNEPVEEESELEKLKEELEAAKDRYLRKVAEFDNSRRRHSKELKEIIQTASKDIIRDLLEVIDDSERAQKQMEVSDDVVALREGLVLVFNKLRSILQARGLKPMNALHQEFNPDLHEAVSEVPTSDENLKGKVVDELVKGYYLNEHIIRYSKVVVGK